MKNYITVDIGGTSIKYGVLTDAEDFLSRGSVDTEAKQYGGPGIVKKLHQIIRDALCAYEIAGVCVSTAGMVDCARGVITHSAPLIPNYIGTEIKAGVENAFHLPCEVENDVNCAGLAEFYSGAARESESCLCLTVGTGIGGAFIQNGAVHHGFSGSGCEIGYMHLPGGEFQDLASVTALVQNAARKKGLPADSLNGKIIFEQAMAGDTIAESAIDEMCDYLGMGIANICYVLNPQTVVLGGGIMADRDYLAPKIGAALDRYLLPTVRKNTALAFALHGNNAGMIGAWQHFKLCRRDG